MDRSYITQDFSLKQVCEYPPFGWENVFKFAEPELEKLSEILAYLGEYYPRKCDLFKAFDLCPLHQVKVVILGQDPYHSTNDDGSPQAMGMSFSTRKGYKVQPSLQNIYKELKRNFPDYQIPNHGDLTHWAQQGVLLLNSCLTVKPHEAGSHMGIKKGDNQGRKNEAKVNIWSGFMAKVLTAINQVNPACVFMLWGGPAIAMGADLGKQAIQVVATHPSPQSAFRASKEAPAFYGSGNFQQVNEHLIKQGKTPIDWQISA